MAATKTAKTTKTAAETNGRTPREKPAGLGAPMYRILKYLAKVNKAASRNEIAEKAPVDLAFLSTYIGSSDPEVRAANEAKRGVKGLLTLGYVTDQKHEGSPVEYKITAAGKKAITVYEKATAK